MNNFFLPKLILICVLGFTTFSCAVTKPKTAKEVTALAYQKDLNKKYQDPKKTILKAGDLKLLKEKGGLPFFPVNDGFRVMADFRKFSKPEVIKLKTSTTRLAEYAIYGEARFKLNGKVLKVNLYKSTKANMPVEYRNLLFLPYRDLTSGEESYGGGRYIDVPTPTGDKVVIDFNKSYHPYCAYTLGYSCPIPPDENYLDVRIEAGIKMVELGEH